MILECIVDSGDFMYVDNNFNNFNGVRFEIANNNNEPVIYISYEEIEKLVKYLNKSLGDKK